MKRTVLLILVVLLLLCAAASYWFISQNNNKHEFSRWFAQSFEGVRSVHVQGIEGSYMLQALEDGWEAQVPGASWNITARALPDRVDEYLTKLAELTPHRSVGGFDRGGPEEYGLDSPHLKIIVSFEGREDTPLTVKLKTDASGRVFGWNSDNPGLVYEFDKKPLEQFNLPASYFLDRRVFSFDEEVVSKLQLVQPFGSSWVVEKQKEGFFFSLPGYLKEKPASDSALKLYIHALALLRANNLILEPVVTDKRMPSLTIKLWQEKNDEPEVVEFFTVKDDPAQYIGKSSWLTVPFLLDSQSVAQLVRSAFDVQGRTVVKIDIGEVARFIVKHGDNEYGIEKGETGWQVNGQGKDIPGIDMSLWRFTELQFEALPLNNLSETAVKLMYCKLLDENGDKLTALTFFADPSLPQGQCWMKNGGGMYYPVSSRLLKDLQGMFPASKGTNE